MEYYTANKMTLQDAFNDMGNSYYEDKEKRIYIHIWEICMQMKQRNNWNYVS